MDNNHAVTCARAPLLSLTAARGDACKDDVNIKPEPLGKVRNKVWDERAPSGSAQRPNDL